MCRGACPHQRLRLERDPCMGELNDYAHGMNVTYPTVLGTVQQFAPALWVRAVAHDMPTAADSCVTADGAEWRWHRGPPDYFPDSSLKPGSASVWTTYLPVTLIVLHVPWTKPSCPRIVAFSCSASPDAIPEVPWLPLATGHLNK